MGQECKCVVFVSYQQFGEIEDCQMEDSSLSAVITFRTRAEAEQVHTLPLVGFSF